MVPITSPLITRVGSSWIAVLLLAEASQSLPDGRISLTKELSKGCPVEVVAINRKTKWHDEYEDSKGHYCHYPRVIARNKICCLNDINGCLILAYDDCAKLI